MIVLYVFAFLGVLKRSLIFVAPSHPLSFFSFLVFSGWISIQRGISGQPRYVVIETSPPLRADVA